MRIRWYGHSAFRITFADGMHVVVDPYESGAFGGAISYGPIRDAADIVLISHDHSDHNHTGGIAGAFTEVREAGLFEMGSITITSIATSHDPNGGSERGQNLIFVIDAPADGLRVVHLGDLGHTLNQDILSRIGRVDVLMIPVGGFFTIDAATATEVMNAVRPSITIPMHFKTEKVEFPITGVDEFTKDKERVRKMDASEMEVVKAELPREPEIRVLRYAD
jgi:L-ascorbate metabolism protein UlaG (beta-lactamase superfamily)